MDPLSDEELAGLRADLLALVDGLAQQLSQSKEGSKPVDLDEPIGRLSRVDAMQQQSMVVANRRAAQLRQRQARAALERLDDGEYGDCQECGDPIEYRRLEARPETPLCLACQSARERTR